MDPEAVLSKVMVARAYNSAHQELIARQRPRGKGIIEKNKIKLVIVDNAVAHWRPQFLGRGTLAERQQRWKPVTYSAPQDTRRRSTALLNRTVTNQV